jgi:hypothetical protein
MWKNIATGVALVAVLGAGTAIGGFWPTLHDRTAAAMDARVKAFCEQLAEDRPWEVRQCMEPTNHEKVAWMLGKLDAFCEGHAGDKRCQKTQQEALVRITQFANANPLIEPDDCMVKSVDEHKRMDLEKTYYCLVAAEATR